MFRVGATCRLSYRGFPCMYLASICMPVGWICDYSNVRLQLCIGFKPYDLICVSCACSVMHAGADRWANGSQYHPCESSIHMRSSRTAGRRGLSRVYSCGNPPFRFLFCVNNSLRLQFNLASFFSDLVWKGCLPLSFRFCKKLVFFQRFTIAMLECGSTVAFGSWRSSASDAYSNPTFPFI